MTEKTEDAAKVEITPAATYEGNQTSPGRNGLIISNRIKTECGSVQTGENYFSDEETKFLLEMTGNGENIYRDTQFPEIALVGAIVTNRTLKQVMRKIDLLWTNGEIVMCLRQKGDSKKAYTRKQYLASIFDDESNVSKIRSVSLLSVMQRRLLEETIVNNPFATPEMIAFALAFKKPFNRCWGGSSYTDYIAEKLIDPRTLGLKSPGDFGHTTGYGRWEFTPASTVNLIRKHYGQFFSFMDLPDLTSLLGQLGLRSMQTTTRTAVADPKTFDLLLESIKKPWRIGVYHYPGIKYHQEDLSVEEIIRAIEVRYHRVLGIGEQKIAYMKKTGDLDPSYEKICEMFPPPQRYAPGFIKGESPDAKRASPGYKARVAQQISAVEPIHVVDEVSAIEEIPVVEDFKVVEVVVAAVVDGELVVTSSNPPVNVPEPDPDETINLLKDIYREAENALSFSLESICCQGSALLSLYRETVANRKQVTADLDAIKAKVDQAITNLSNQPPKPDLESFREQITEEVRRDLMRKLFSNVVTISDKNS